MLAERTGSSATRNRLPRSADFGSSSCALIVPGFEAADAIGCPLRGLCQHGVLRRGPSLQLGKKTLFATVPHGNGDVPQQPFAPGPLYRRALEPSLELSPVHCGKP